MATENSQSDTHAEDKSCDEAIVRAALAKAGCRFTRQRLAVHNYLQSVRNHPTVEQVCAGVRRDMPNLSLATVYKSLEALVACGLAGKLAFSEGPVRYDCRSENHYHIRCLDTGEVHDLDVPFDPTLLDQLSPALREQLTKRGFDLRGYRLELVGVRSNL